MANITDKQVKTCAKLLECNNDDFNDLYQIYDSAYHPEKKGRQIQKKYKF
jgi:hypothetical protein